MPKGVKSINVYGKIKALNIKRGNIAASSSQISINYPNSLHPSSWNSYQWI
jgi:hypothetical protein